MRRALVVGIENYSFQPLDGCVKDALKMQSFLAYHQEYANVETPKNFECTKLLSSEHEVNTSVLKEHLERLFRNDQDIDVALFYFSGHGYLEMGEGYLVTLDASKHSPGVDMSFILRLANQATKIREVVIILDCCHAGALGQAPLTGNNQASLREGISILASSKDGQTSVESVDGGLFTSTVCDALDGGAADILGNVTVASIYEYVEQLFGANDQRPMLKSHISRIFPLRKCKPAISLETLKKLPTHFLNADDEFPLDPSFEPTADPKHEEREMIFSRLQKYCAARLLVPVSEEHMYYAAMNSKSCKLTPLGKYYWRLAKDGKFGPPDDSYI